MPRRTPIGKERSPTFLALPITICSTLAALLNSRLPRRGIISTREGRGRAPNILLDRRNQRAYLGIVMRPPIPQQHRHHARSCEVSTHLWIYIYVYVEGYAGKQSPTALVTFSRGFAWEEPRISLNA